MRILVVVSALALTGSMAMADIAEPVSVVNYAKYNLTTGKVKVGGGGHRTHQIAWDSTNQTGFFSNRVSTQWVVDWGDVPAGNLVLNTVDGFQIGYATNSTVPVDIEVRFYENGNGFNDVSNQVAAFLLTGLPGSNTGGVQAWIVDVNLGSSAFIMNGPDKDSIPGQDFEYSYNMANRGNATSMGPLISTGGHGQEDAFDRYDGGPQGSGTYAGTFFFGGNPFAQFHMRLYTIPAPGSLALVGLGGLLAARRRR